jgi:predicted Zn-dependent peptidase
MRSLDVSQDNLDNQRNAVQEERRLNYDNRPYGTVYEKLFNLTYDNFAYKHSTIGSMADLNAASLKDVQDFFTRYYAPNNAVITLVGDVTAETALPLIEKYFGDIPSQPQPVIPDLTEALNKGERRMTWEDPQAPQPRIDMAYPTLEANSTDYYALDMLSTILGGSESSRIYQKLVKEKAVATSAGSYALMRRGSSPLTFSATVAPGSDVETVEKLINEEIVRVQNELVTDEELASARTTLRAQLVDMLSSSRMTATIMGELAVYFGSPQLINEFPAYYQALTAADLKRVAQKYLQPSNRGVVITLPAAKPAAAPASGPAGK